MKWFRSKRAEHPGPVAGHEARPSRVRGKWRLWVGAIAAAVGAGLFFTSTRKDVRMGAAGAAGVGAALLIWGVIDGHHATSASHAGSHAKAHAVHRVASSAKPNFAANIAAQPEIHPRAHVHDLRNLIGRVVVSEGAHVAPCSLRADEEGPFFIGPGANVQDGVMMHALGGKKISVDGEEWAIYVGKGASLAHGALIHGPAYIGAGSFVGFRATVHNSIVGPGCFIGHGTTVLNVDIPAGRSVPVGSPPITTQAQADALPMATEEELKFAGHVAHTNNGLAEAYKAWIAQQRKSA